MRASLCFTWNNSVASFTIWFKNMYNVKNNVRNLHRTLFSYYKRAPHVWLFVSQLYAKIIWCGCNESCNDHDGENEINLQLNFHHFPPTWVSSNSYFSTIVPGMFMANRLDLNKFNIAARRLKAREFNELRKTFLRGSWRCCRVCFLKLFISITLSTLSIQIEWMGK